MATLRSRLSSVFTDNVQNHWASCDKELELFAHRDFTRIFSPSHQIDLNHANWKRKKTEKKTKKTCSLHVTCSSYHNVVCSPWQSSCKGKKATQWIKFLHLYCTSSQFSNPPPKKKKKAIGQCWLSVSILVLIKQLPSNTVYWHQQRTSHIFTKNLRKQLENF